MKAVDKEASTDGASKPDRLADLAKRLVGNEEAVKLLVATLEDIAEYPQETTDFESRYLATLASNTLAELTRDELAKEVKNLSEV